MCSSSLKSGIISRRILRKFAFYERLLFYYLMINIGYNEQNIRVLQMTGEVTERFNGKTLFHLDKKQCIALQNLKFISPQSRRLLSLGSFTDPLLDWMEFESLGRMLMRDLTDRWPRIVSCCSIR